MPASATAVFPVQEGIEQTEDVTQTAEYDAVLAQEADLAAGHGVLRATGD